MGEWEVKKYRPQNRLWLLLGRSNVGITFEAVRELVWIFSLSGREWADLKAGVNNSLDSSWSGGEKERLEACWRPWRSAWGTWWGKVIKVAGGVCKKGTVREGSITGPLLHHRHDLMLPGAAYGVHLTPHCFIKDKLAHSWSDYLRISCFCFLHLKWNSCKVDIFLCLVRTWLLLSFTLVTLFSVGQGLVWSGPPLLSFITFFFSTVLDCQIISASLTALCCYTPKIWRLLVTCRPDFLSLPSFLCLGHFDKDKSSHTLILNL